MVQGTRFGGFSIAAIFALICFASAALATSAARAASNVVQYTYDAAGNIVAMRRDDDAALGIAGFAPSSGPARTAVTISGNGFPPTGVDAAVAFNGTAATVLDATSTTITAIVPSGATTGRISVTAAGKTVSSSADFVVTPPGVPTILDFAPAAGAAGTSVTARGTNFNPATGATTVRLNQSAATPSAVTPTQLTFSVPSATGSGKVRIATSTGSAISAADFVVPPAAVVASDIVTTTRLVANGPAQSVAIFTRNKFGMLLFDVNAGDWLSVQFANFAINPAGGAITYAVYRPDNTQLSSGTLSPSNLTIHLPPLAAAGTYTLLLGSGNAQLSLDAKLEANSFIPGDGSALAMTRSAGQTTRALIAGVAGEQKALTVSGMTTVPAGTSLQFVIAMPSGTAFRQGTALGLGTTTPLPPFAVTGTHPVTFTPLSPTTQSAFSVTMLTGAALPIDGAALDIAIDRPGAGARATFTANAGENLGIGVTGLTLGPASATGTTFAVFKPDSNALIAGSCSTNGANCSANLSNLPVSGTYSVIVQPANGATATLKLWLSHDITGSLVSGTPTQLALRPGQNGKLVFTGEAGALTTVQVRNISTAPAGQGILEQIFQPGGALLAYGHLTGTGQTLVPPALPAAGTYTIFIEPEPAAMGAAAATMEVMLDPGQALVADGPAVPATIAVVGGSARFTFAGVAGQNLGFGLGNLAFNPVADASVTVYRPDGPSIASTSCAYAQGRCDANLANLPATGAYAVVVRPAGGATGSFVATLSSDLAGTLSVGGSLAVSLDRIGRNARLTFAGGAGQTLRLGWSGVAIPGSPGKAIVYVYQPNGSVLTSVQFGNGATGGLDLPALPVVGNYTISVDPISGATMNATFSLTAR